MLLGSEVGIWCACFSHFVLRDQVFCFFRKLTHDLPPIDKARAWKYILVGTGIIVGTMFFTCIVSSIMGAVSAGYDQLWLTNLRDTCGKSYDTDENGLLIFDVKS